MNVFRSRPALRWLVPTAAAVVVIGGGAAAGTIVASADPGLPPRSAAQLLVDLQNAKVDGFSGTIVQTADLGLPPLSGITGGQGDADLTKLITGNNTARVWYAGQDKVRLALLGTLGETDVIRNGTDVWMWRSAGNTATHLTIPAGQKAPATAATLVPSSPQEAADAALKAIDPTTSVTTNGNARVVAGRSAYELILKPKDTASLIGQVGLAIDSKTHIPLRVDVYAKGATNPAFRVAFQDISFVVPDAQQFKFNPPPGAKVETKKAEDIKPEDVRPGGDKSGVPARPELVKPDLAKGDEPKVVGTGWASVVVAKMPAAEPAKNSTATPTGGVDAAQITGLINGLPKVSGAWGSGHVLKGSLFSVLVTDDGRVLAGAVAPEKLFEVAAAK